MSEAFDVFKEKVELALDELVERKQPPRPGGDIYIQHLRGRIRGESSIGISDIIKHLALAGYSMEDIIRFFHRIGIVTTENDVVRLKDAVRRVLTSLVKEG